MDALGYYNGNWGPLDEMTVPMNDRGCYFGDGVYDAASSANGVIFALDEHVDRFFRSAGMLEVELHYTKEDLKKILNEMLAKVSGNELFVYWQATRGTGRRNHAFSSGPSNLMVIIKPYPVPNLSKKVKLITIEDKRYFFCHIKTINLIPNVIAAQWALEAGSHEAIFHRGDIVTECSHSNVHIIKDGKFITHQKDNLILQGIARSHLAKVCDRMGIPVEERDFTLSELFNADEVITSSATSFALSAFEIDGKPVGGKAPELLKKLQNEVMREFSEVTGYIWK